MQVNVSWTWNQTPGDTYELYYGTSSGNYEQAVAASNGMKVTLQSGTTYYFALTAVRKGMESDKSPEFKYPP